jgi:hypothetical protein
VSSHALAFTITRIEVIDGELAQCIQKKAKFGNTHPTQPPVKFRRDKEDDDDGNAPATRKKKEVKSTVKGAWKRAEEDLLQLQMRLEPLQRRHKL